MGQNVFQFDNTLFKRTNKTATRNLLSLFVVEIFTSRFEIGCRKNMINFAELWFVYTLRVYDLFAMVDVKLNLEKFPENLYSQYNTIKFTDENEIEGKLPLLDLQKCSEKKTNTYRCIPNNSNQCWQHKMAARNSMVYRHIKYSHKQ